MRKDPRFFRRLRVIRVPPLVSLASPWGWFLVANIIWGSE
jgi:hypothetical protein